ncbi:aKG-HExxH-type peptide beta-hydroxylase [Streptomyces sp. NPDC014889]|uniref:aKG-HExxH-type peptide beta-hydroxylase n=1 Tax=Streptomyces sp. NPDC014889 TaxID=3364928 RepID=UPI003701C34E
MDRRRLVLIRVGDAAEFRRLGTGYLIGRRLVLTARHVVEESKGMPWAQIRVRVGHPQDTEVHRCPASVCWTDPEEHDVALLLLDDEVDVPGRVRWGRPVGNTPLRYQGLGYPSATFRDGQHKVEYLSGKLPPQAGGIGTQDLYVLDQESAPDMRAHGEQAWSGASGGAVFCQDHLVGVVVNDDEAFANRRLHASPARTFTGNSQFATLLHRYGDGPPELVDIKAAPASEPAWVSRRLLPHEEAQALGTLAVEVLNDRSQTLATVPLAVPQRRVAAERLRGRAGLVAKLTSAVTRRVNGDARVPGVWLLCGMGGCGKTTVALETAHRLAASSTRVWWVSGADGEGLSGGLRAVAFSAGAQAAEFVGAHPADVLWRRLDALTTPWLLVLDNVDDPALLAAAPSRTAEGIGWLRPPAHRWGAVLITSQDSRTERWGQWVHMVGVDLLSKEHGAQVLRDLAPQAGTVQDAQDLGEHLGGLPLALNLAGSYLARALEDPWPSPSTPVTFAEYRGSFDARLAEMASDPDTDLGPAERSRRTIQSTWELSLELLHRQGAHLARPLLRLLSALGPAPIPYQKLLDPEMLAESGLLTDPTQPRINDALKGLAGLKLITIETTRDSEAACGPAVGPPRWITLHPMVRAASRSHPDFTAQVPLLLRLVTALLHRFTDPLTENSTGDWPLWRAIAPHCAAARVLLHECESSVGTDRVLVTEATGPALRAAQYHIYVGMYGEAVTELASVAEARGRLLGDEDRATIAARLYLAWALRENGDLDQADRLYEDVGRTCERALEDGHPYMQSAKTGRARVLRELGRFEAAEAELRAALAMRRHDPQAGPRGILRIKHDLATLAHKRGRVAEAVTELQVTTRQHEELAGPADRDTLAMKVSLVRALRDAGHAAEAENAAEDVVRVYLTVLPPDHPEVLLARHERARLIRDHESDTEFLERARDEFTEIWQINERRLGPGHPDTIAARHELATVWHLLGRPERAADHYRAALEAGKTRLGHRHPDVMLCAGNLATVLAELAEREGNSMDDPQEPRDPLTSHTPDLTAVTLEQALSDEHASTARPAAARLLGRYLRPRTSRGGSEGSAGYSGGTGGGEGGTPVHYRPVVNPRTAEPRPVLPFPSPADVRNVADGREDRSLVERLRAQQRGTRAVALAELLRRLRLADEAISEREGGLPSVGEVKELLLQAEQANAEAVTAVLLHPSVGRWLSSALRALHTPPGGPSTATSTPSAHVPHLHAVAAAAAVKAKIAFTLPVPVRDGFVFLPSLGAADFRGTTAITAHVAARDDAALIRCSGTEVRLPSTNDPCPPGWLPVHRVRTPVGRSHFDLVLEDMDPYREADGSAPPRRLAPADVTRWRRKIGDAAELLTDVVGPEQAEALAAGLISLTPRPESNSGMMTSVSASDAFGGAALSTPPDAVELAVTLIHEFRHMKLNAVLDSLDLYDDEGPEELYYAPWRDDPRPLPGFFHGVFAFLGVVEFWQRLAHSASARLRRRAQFQLLYWRAQTREAYEALRSSRRLTEAGREFTARMGVGMAQAQNPTAVPDEVTALAEDAVVAHRIRWRLHHLRPDPGTVTALAEAWSSSAPRPPSSHIRSVLAPDPTAQSLNDYTALLCRIAVDPSRLHRTPPEGAAQNTHDPSDLARLLGETDSARRLATDQVTQRPRQHEPWVRLALALRRPNPTAFPGAGVAMRVMSHRPEAVRAVHARITTLTDTPPDPTALAEWIGISDGTTDLTGLTPMHGL